MDLSESLHIWRRRWILTAVLLILASAGIAASLSRLPRVYQSASSVVLLASRSAARLNGGNPYLSFSPSLTLTADAVSRELIAPGTVRGLSARGFPAAYTVTLAPGTTQTTGSVLLVTVTDKDKAVVERTLRAVTAEISIRLAQLQAGVRLRSQIRATALSVDPQATLSVSQTARPLAVVAVLALLLALGIPVAVDGKITRRQIRNRAALPAAPQVDSPADGQEHGGRVIAKQPTGDWPLAQDGRSRRARASR